MSEGLNRVMLLGNLGADPELRFGQGPDQAVLRLRLATTESYLDKRTNERKERTDWHNVVVFGKRGEALQRILAKGSTIFVEGRLQTSSYENKEGQKVWKTDIIANNIILAGGRGGAAREERVGGAVPAERPSFGRGAAGGAGAPRGEGTGGAVGGAPARGGHDPGSDDTDGGGAGGGSDDDIPF